MMQSYASAAKLRAAGPFSPSASVPCQLPVPATSDRQSTVRAESSRERRIGKKMLFPRPSTCRTQDDALQCFAAGDKAPKRDEQLAWQRDNHRLARASTAIGSAGLVPPGQCALLLKPQKAPGRLDHAAADPGVAGSGEPLFPPLRAVLVRRARQAGVARYRFAVAHCRESTSLTSISAVSTPTPTTRATCRTMACGSVSGSIHGGARQPSVDRPCGCRQPCRRTLEDVAATPDGIDVMIPAGRLGSASYAACRRRRR